MWAWWRRKRKVSAAVAALLLGCPISSMAQQPADQPLAVAPPTSIVGQTAAAIAAEGRRTGTLQTNLDEKLVAERDYYLWRDGCYIRQQSGDFYSVPLASCR
jgi:hypothetical protein